MQIKINNDILDCQDVNTQLSFGSHASIHANFDLVNHPGLENFFVKLRESNSKFTIVSSKFMTSGTSIKTFDIDFKNKKMHVSFNCEIYNTTESSLRRDEAITEILSKTFDTFQDIK